MLNEVTTVTPRVWEDRMTFRQKRDVALQILFWVTVFAVFASGGVWTEKLVGKIEVWHLLAPVATVLIAGSAFLLFSPKQKTVRQLYHSLHQRQLNRKGYFLAVDKPSYKGDAKLAKVSALLTECDLGLQILNRGLIERSSQENYGGALMDIKGNLSAIVDRLVPVNSRYSSEIVEEDRTISETDPESSLGEESSMSGFAPNAGADPYPKSYEVVSLPPEIAISELPSKQRKEVIALRKLHQEIVKIREEREGLKAQNPENLLAPLKKNAALFKDHAEELESAHISAIVHMESFTQKAVNQQISLLNKEIALSIALLKRIIPELTNQILDQDITSLVEVNKKATQLINTLILPGEEVRELPVHYESGDEADALEDLSFLDTSVALDQPLPDSLHTDGFLDEYEI